MKNLFTLSLILIFTASSYAQWGKRIKGNGNVVTIERNTGDYDGVSVAGWFDVELVKGKEGNITLKGEENLLEYIITEVENDKLVVKVEKGVNLKSSNWRNGISITIPVEEISELSMSGSGDISSSVVLDSDNLDIRMSGSGDCALEVQAKNLEVRLSGSGDLKFAGNTTNFDVTVSGSGDISAYELEADNVEATVSGSADIKVTANNAIEARVSGSGDITYKGNPSRVRTKSSGSGDVSKY
jgi:hypothetical protein